MTKTIKKLTAEDLAKLMELETKRETMEEQIQDLLRDVMKLRATEEKKLSVASSEIWKAIYENYGLDRDKVYGIDKNTGVITDNGKNDHDDCDCFLCTLRRTLMEKAANVSDTPSVNGVPIKGKSTMVH